MAPRRTSLPTERTKPSSARCAVAARERRAILGRRRQHDHAAGRLDPADRRPEELPQLAQPRRVGDSRGVEDERLEALVARGLGIPDGGVEAGVADGASHLAFELAANLGADRRQHAAAIGARAGCPVRRRAAPRR